jgi:hypothetical protein
MSGPRISSDPHAWLRPYWADLHQQSTFFAKLAPELQAEALAEAIEAEHPTMAAEIRSWNSATRRAYLASLDVSLIEKRTDKQVELWRMQKGTREVQCIAVYTPVGADLRLLEKGDWLRTELIREPFVADARAKQWREALMQSGWR